MDLGLIFGIVLVLLILTFGTLTIVFSLKSWHWLHITGFCLFLVTLPPAMYYIAAYARTVNAWGADYNKVTKSLNDARIQSQKLKVGDPPTSPNPATPGKIQAEAALDRLMLQRGRVWRDCTATPFAPVAGGGAASTLRTVPADAPPADAAKNKNGITPNSEIFIFRQLTDAAGATTALGYVGRFGVTAATDSEVTISPSEFVDQQQAAFFGPGSKFTIYEALPTDDNAVFDDIPAEQREAAIRAAFAPYAPGGPLSTGLPQAEFDAMVTSFLRHGKEKLDSDRPEAVWTKVKIVDLDPVEVDAASIPGVDTQLFDSQGRAIRGVLQRGQQLGPVKLSKGAEIVLDSASAEQLIRDGKAEKVSDVYLRVEKDFDTGFRILSKQTTDIAAEMQKVQRNITSMQETIKRLETEIAYRTKEKGMLETDLGKFQNDATVMTKVANELKDAHAKLLDRLSEVYRKNQDMLAKIAEVDAKLTEEINKRSQTAANP